MSTILSATGVGAVAGLLGQAARALLGLAKKQPGTKVDAGRLAGSLGLGAVAGTMAALGIDLDPAHLVPSQLLAVVTAGYAGADAIEAIARPALSTQPAQPDPAAQPAQPDPAAQPAQPGVVAEAAQQDPAIQPAPLGIVAEPAPSIRPTA